MVWEQLPGFRSDERAVAGPAHHTATLCLFYLIDADPRIVRVRGEWSEDGHVAHRLLAGLGAREGEVLELEHVGVGVPQPRDDDGLRHGRTVRSDAHLS